VSDRCRFGSHDYLVGVSEGRAAQPGAAVPARRRGLSRIKTLNRLWRLSRETVSICLLYRVTGLAAEAGFFALLSLPPLILGLFGGVGYFGKAMGRNNVQALTDKVTDLASKVLTESTVQDTIVPTLNDVFKNGRADLISIGFLLSLWSGSRVLNVIVDTISIMYGQSGVRGIVRTRVLSFSLYVASLVVGVVVFPLVVLGPDLLRQILSGHVEWLLWLYWPVVVIVTVASLCSLYWISTPRRSSWLRNVPGAALALVIWIGASVVLRWELGESVGPRSTSIYGPLAAPIVVLIWLYFLAIAVLIGAALNAATRKLWPAKDRPRRRFRTGGGMIAQPAASSESETGTSPLAAAGARPLTPLPPQVLDTAPESTKPVQNGARERAAAAEPATAAPPVRPKSR
jgi:membrane protein